MAKFRFFVSLFRACASLLLLWSSKASADPWFGWGENRIEERYEDGDIDNEDVLVAARSTSRLHAGRERAGSWVSLAAFAGARSDGTRDFGMLAVVGLALDRASQGPHRGLPVPIDTTYFTASSEESPEPSSKPRALTSPDLVSPAVAHSAVSAALVCAGLGTTSARIDGILVRARQSALLPEVRLRAMRRFDESSRVDTVPAEDRFYDTSGANLWLEARLTWRLDRLVYSDDEPTLERVRLEYQDARTRLASRVLEALFKWQRARVERRTSAPESPEEVSARIRIQEAETTLDVLTGGWFAGWLAGTLSLP